MFGQIRVSVYVPAVRYLKIWICLPLADRKPVLKFGAAGRSLFIDTSARSERGEHVGTLMLRENFPTKSGFAWAEANHSQHTHTLGSRTRNAVAVQLLAFGFRSPCVSISNRNRYSIHTPGPSVVDRKLPIPDLRNVLWAEQCSGLPRSGTPRNGQH